MGWVAGLALGGKVANFYTLDGTPSPPEEELTHLRGYRDSRPVRIGNGAADQLQLDVYGELLNTAYLYASRGGKISTEAWGELAHLADLAAERWNQPDASIWEVRGTDQDFTCSKVMCWVALDRALKIARHRQLSADTVPWEQAREAVRQATDSRGWAPEVGAYTQASATPPSTPPSCASLRSATSTPGTTGCTAPLPPSTGGCRTAPCLSLRRQADPGRTFRR